MKLEDQRRKLEQVHALSPSTCLTLINLHPLSVPGQDRARMESDRRKAEAKRAEDERRAKAAEEMKQRAAAEADKKQRDDANRRKKAEEEARKRDAERQAKVNMGIIAQYNDYHIVPVWRCVGHTQSS